jgi:dTDP-glucose 4,6-dehydratase
MKKLLVTGGAGFIGSAFVKNAVQNNFSVSVVDKLTYAGDIQRLAPVKTKISFHKIDICDHKKMAVIFKQEKPDAIIHFAAETHVDRSILNSSPFIKTNIQGTAHLINLALKYHIKKFLHVSTDEVYGEIKKGHFHESSPLNPKNPYSSSKAAADFLIQSAIRAYKLPAIIIRPCNNYGPWQYPEKFIPVAILYAMQNKKVPVYGNGRNIREWIYVDDCAQAILTILKKGKAGEIYNIGSGDERKNIQVVQTILSLLNRSNTLYKFVKDRPGHDLRYASDCKKLKKLGWQQKHIFETGLEKTILWTEEHLNWVTKKTNSLKNYWELIYKKK